ncbi:MAG: ParB N-terminal domain-containing protein [Oscillospiraceae bacterium]|jgi:ParB family chromosome partitioning protein|nr:ParB N-terminal domain-containing protein [Oscillospiraceae bacterium]
MSNASFALKSMKEINRGLFTPTDPAARRKGETVFNLPFDSLRPFKNHPFKPYQGQRFDDMVESIRENGMLVPIIARPIKTDSREPDVSDSYEILSGHNRVEAAKAAGIENIPAIVREGLTDEEALLIVTETNLIQRSFADLTHSERAVTLTMHHEAIKRQGRRTDLIREIESMLKNPDEFSGNSTSAPVGQKLTTRDKIAQDYGLAKNTVARYLRVNKLIDALKTRLDDGELPIRAAVSLSYLTTDEQRIVDDALNSSHYKADMKKADSLRLASEKKPLDRETVEQILAGTKKPRSAKPGAFKLKAKIVTRYFLPGQKNDEIEATIIEALEYFYAHKKQETEVNPYGGDDNGDSGSKELSEHDTAGTPLTPEITVG